MELESERDEYWRLYVSMMEAGLVGQKRERHVTSEQTMDVVSMLVPTDEAVPTPSTTVEAVQRHALEVARKPLSPATSPLQQDPVLPSCVASGLSRPRPTLFLGSIRASSRAIRRLPCPVWRYRLELVLPGVVEQLVPVSRRRPTTSGSSEEATLSRRRRPRRSASIDVDAQFADDTEVVHVEDREGDIFDSLATRAVAGMHFIVRACSNRVVLDSRK